MVISKTKDGIDHSQRPDDINPTVATHSPRDNAREQIFEQVVGMDAALEGLTQCGGAVTTSFDLLGVDKERILEAFALMENGWRIDVGVGVEIQGDDGLDVEILLLGRPVHSWYVEMLVERQ